MKRYKFIRVDISATDEMNADLLDQLASLDLRSESEGGEETKGSYKIVSMRIAGDEVIILAAAEAVE